MILMMHWHWPYTICIWNAEEGELRKSYAMLCMILKMITLVRIYIVHSIPFEIFFEGT